MKTYAYIRVSTGHQDYDAQRAALDAYAKPRLIKIDEYIEDTVSGRKHWKERKLGKIELRAGDRMVFNEVSRIGRNTLDILEYLKFAAEAGAEVHIAQLGMILDSSIGSHVIVTTLALVAEIERIMTSARVKEGLDAAKRRGVKLGRPKSGGRKSSKLDKSKDEIVAELARGVTKSRVAKDCGVTRKTLYNWLTIHAPELIDGKDGEGSR